MKEKSFAFLLTMLVLLLLGGCTRPALNTNQELVFTSSSTPESIYQEPSAPDFTDDVSTGDAHLDLVLNDRHSIQADVEGDQYTHLDAYALEPLSLSAEECLNIFAPEDTGTYTVQKAEEGFRLISQMENRCYISPYRVYFEKENEIQKKINNELLHLLELYAQEDATASAQNLDFIDQISAVQMVEDILNKLGVNLEPVLQNYAALPAQAIMSYQQELLKRDLTSEEKYYDPFGKAHLLDNLNQENDACFLSFTFDYQGIPIYKGSPTVSYIDGVTPPDPVTLSVLITRQGLQIFDGQSLYRAGLASHSGDILSAREAADLYCQKYDLVIHPDGDAMRVSSIYLEYIPVVSDAGTILTPYWCFPIEVNFPVGWYEVSSERFNAFTGEDITYGG